MQIERPTVRAGVKASERSKGISQPVRMLSASSQQLQERNLCFAQQYSFSHSWVATQSQKYLAVCAHLLLEVSDSALDVAACILAGRLDNVFHELHASKQPLKRALSSGCNKLILATIPIKHCSSKLLF